MGVCYFAFLYFCDTAPFNNKNPSELSFRESNNPQKKNKSQWERAASTRAHELRLRSRKATVRSVFWGSTAMRHSSVVFFGGLKSLRATFNMSGSQRSLCSEERHLRSFKNASRAAPHLIKWRGRFPGGLRLTKQSAGRKQHWWSETSAWVQGQEE